MKRKTFLIACLGSIAGAAGLARAQAPIKLRFSHAGPETSSQHIAALEFAKMAKERSKGALDVQVYPGSQLGNDSTVIGGVRGGTIDMMMAGSVNCLRRPGAPGSVKNAASRSRGATRTRTDPES